MPSGNVVKYHKELYIVADSKYDWKLKRFDSYTLLPFNHSNCTVHVSRKHPVTKAEAFNIENCNECDYEFNSHEDCLCCNNVNEVPNPEFAIDTIEKVADNINDFIMGKFKKLLYGE